MHSNPPNSHDAVPSRMLLGAAGVIVAAALLGYANSFSGPFVFDDKDAVLLNPSIHDLARLRDVLAPPEGHTVTGRPLINLSLALNYAVSGTRVWSYHVLNLLIHVSAALVLFGIVRRTLLQPRLRTRFGAAALPLALASAVLWAVHPLTTECVTYIIQRAESIMALFYLLTLYCFIRGQESHVLRDIPRARFWYGAALVASLLGMASKEIMVSAPVLLLLYDRTFISGSLREAWRQRKGFFSGLAVTWLPLAVLAVKTGTRGDTVGLGLGVSWGTYALSQFQALSHYLFLTWWPHPLIFDYGAEWIKHPAEILPGLLVVVAFAAATAVGLWRRSPGGFAGAWFFIILAPTYLIPLVRQTMAEHRMYLPLAALIAYGVAGAYTWIGRRLPLVVLAASVGLGWLTHQRNAAYRTELALWQDTVAKRPNNAWAHYNAGLLLVQAQRLPEAMHQYEETLRVEPNYFEAHDNLGIALLQLDRVPEAIAHFRAALRLKPDDAEAMGNLGLALDRTGHTSEALEWYQRAVHANPAEPGMYVNYGNSLARTGKLTEAIACYEQALRLKPDDAGTHFNLGAALAQNGQPSAAIAHFETVLRLKPDDAEALGMLRRLRSTTRP